MTGHKVEQEKGYIIVDEDSSEGIHLNSNGKASLTSDVWGVVVWSTREFAEDSLKTRGHGYWDEDIDYSKLHVEEVVFVTSKTILPTRIDEEKEEPRQVTQQEKELMRELCTEHQAYDQYCDDCPGGCISCQRKWLRDLGWKEEELPTEYVSLFLSDDLIKNLDSSCIPDSQD